MKDFEYTLKTCRVITNAIKTLERCFTGNKRSDEVIEMRIKGYLLSREFLYRKMIYVLKKLPLDQRKVLFMYYGKGMSYGDIADKMKKSSVWVRRQLHLGLNNIRNIEALNR